MFRSKLRTGGSTVLSALLCVLIGLVIGFIALVVLAHVNMNNTYQNELAKYNSDQFEYADIVKVRNYLRNNSASDEMLAAANGQFSEEDLKTICGYVVSNKDKLKPRDKYYTMDEVENILISALPETDPDTLGEKATDFLAVVRTVVRTKPTGYTFGDVISTAYNKGFKAVLLGGWYSMGEEPLGPRGEIADAAPLIMTGLSVAFAFTTGLFNIGAAGQFTLGSFGALFCALVLKLPWYVCMIAAILFGAIWGAIPGVFKAYFNVNEVITSIMFNWIGLYAVNTIMYGGGNSPMYYVKDSKTYRLEVVSPQSRIPDLSGLGSNYFVQPATIAIFFAILIAIILWIMLNKTTFGYELKACGYSKTAAKYAGINEKRNIILSMTIAGALAGLGGALYCLSGSVQWNPQDSTALPAVGFNGISVALLASSHPIGSIFSALFISHITMGGSRMEQGIFPKEIANIISGVIIYLCAFMMLFKNHIAKLFSPKAKGGVK